MGEYLSFFEISKVPFKQVLDWVGVPYTETDTELRGKGFIVTKNKNLYFNPSGQDKGSIINFLALMSNIDLRSAAKMIQNTFLKDEKPSAEKQIPDYQLFYHKFLETKGISEELAKEFELGYCKTGIMRGKIAIKIKDEQGNTVAWIGRNIEPDAKDKYYFYKGYKNDHIYNLWRVKTTQTVILTVSPFDVIHIHKLGFSNVIGLISFQMTEAQENLLKRYPHIFILHPQPSNILQRLSRFAFVKAPEIDKVQALTREDLDALY